MTRLKLDISTSLDGYIAGPDASLQDPLGKGGERLHEWVVGLEGFRKAHGMEGGDSASPDNEIVAEATRDIGAYVMGRKMFSGGSGPWESDPNADAWWGDNPPFHVPVFVLTHHEREPVEKEGGTTFTFVTDGFESALEQARAAAGEKDVSISGGADVAQQALRAGAVDEVTLHIAPVLLGGGTSLFGDLGMDLTLELTNVLEGPEATHLQYVVRR
jgi:dihydrofolate reductase